jgi:hypothetical protein
MKQIWIFMAVALAAAPVSRGDTNYVLQLPGTASAMTTPANSYGERLRDFTVTARVRPSPPSTGTNQIIVQRSSPTRTKFSLGLGPSNGPVFLVGTLGGTLYTIRSDISLCTGRWSHVAATYDHVDNMACLFVDGKIVRSLALLEESVPESIWGGSTTLGARNAAPTNPAPLLDSFFQGTVDEVQIWDGAFTQSQIVSNRYVKPAGTESNLVACWNFDDQTPDDTTTNGMHGTLRGDAQIVARHIACDPPLAVPPGTPVYCDFQTLPNTAYTVESCTDLGAGNWTFVEGNIAGDGGIVRIEDTDAVNSLRFYRVKEQ